MNLGPKLVAKPMLKQTLTPGLVQMVSILAMNKLELQEAITQELLENPLLDEAQEDGPTTLEEILAMEQELRHDPPADNELLAVTAAAAGSASDTELAPEAPPDTGERFESSERDSASLETAPEAAPDPGAEPVAAADPFEEIDFGSFFDEYLDPGYRSASEVEDIEKPSFEQFLSAPTNLSDHLRWQLQATSLTEQGRDAAEAIIGNLDDDGYLTAEDDNKRRPLSLEELAEAEQLPVEALTKGLAVVQGFDPPGIAARDLRECLLLQLKQIATPDPLAVKLVQDHLVDLQGLKYKELSKTLGVTQDEIMAALAVIRKLDPYPGRRYNNNTARLIEPDIFIVKGRSERCSICDRHDCPNEYRVVTNDDGLPQLSLNSQYRTMKWDKSQRDVSRYIRDRYTSALQFLKNLEQRKQTIARVCHSIIARQGEFLERGIDYLKPMMIKEVAEEIGVHPSTVSRAVSNKYAHTPQGVLELRFFFTESVQGARGGETSLVILKRRVKKLIEDENPEKPLTDEQITQVLRDQGIDVTRRTVAKYREDMNIPSTHQRRRKA